MKKNKDKVSIFWFRRDLRVEDNIGLYHALNSSFPVLPIFIFDKNILNKLERDDSRVSFIHECLQNLSEKFRKYDGDLLTFYNSPKNAWKEIFESFDVQEVYTNEDYEPYALSRDKSIEDYLTRKGIKFQSYKDQCIFSKFDILKKDGTPYTVYTPYKNKWLETLQPSDLASIKSEKNLSKIYKFKSEIHSLKSLGFTKSHISFPKRIIKKKIITNYHETRDIPSINGTSLLGVHLRFGTIGPRKLASIAYHTNKTWLNELIWREFFSQILFHFPHVVNAPFREKYESIEWRNNKEEFKLWCEGRTGFPLVDAGMRELNQTGHMHNRVRMLVASFLVKDLLIDWRWGEKYFAKKLLDFDLASNNGNWQWAAGTGCDAAPYFRIFNPTTQIKKFDPDLIYVKKWVPEYGSDNYTEEIVDHKEAYHRAIFTYNKALK
ncbi:deoxyribodipyrimidine photolyase [Halobacteriovorax marinus]|uniref:cryptochrome/photolyase family protein n=1 Tax=Halobacteriovorax marinus TaxID=97084 RepID=UPI000BC3054C|nr:deoxyribodipyrimidine photo-lyase [Halobacteriovorax marinus]ATH08704.1 deoxyribodipyrimidine photolyase [Halobacteriovorax marinus]